MRKLRIILVLVLLAILLYLISFTLFTKVPQGMTGMVSKYAVQAPRHGPYFSIFVSTNSTMNRVGKVVYYPLIRAGEARNWWQFIDDTSLVPDGFPCLLVCLLHQPW